jgi:hypothetical protein
MLVKLDDVPFGIDGLKAVGKLSKSDYEGVFEPLLEQARKDGRRLSMLFELGPDFEGFTAGGAWEDAKIGLRYMRLFDACAIVTDLPWIRASTKLARFMMPCPVQVFGAQEQQKAIDWLRSVPEGAAVSFRLLADFGVMVVEVKQALRAHDFDAMALTADTWIESHGALHGIVIHCREFPGWENLHGVLRHIRFVRDHHRKVGRVALVADSKLASLAPHIAEHFIQAEVKSFGYDELDAAVAWARGAVGQSAASRVPSERRA